MKKKLNVPKVGQKIYVDSAYYIDHGEDDRDGGIATVSKVVMGISAGKKVHFIQVKEIPDVQMNWDQHLRDAQPELRKEFGKQKAKMCPDYTDYGD
jgi:hypothetical protein